MVKDNMMYFWRVVFTYVIAMHHLFTAYGWGVSWYNAVEFFAITSGFLLMHHMLTHPDESLWEYAKKRFYQFAPLIFITSVVDVFVEAYYKTIPIEQIAQKLIGAIPDYLLINTYNFSPRINKVDWYIEALFAVSIPLYYLLKKHKNFVVQFLAPVCAILAYSYLFKQCQYLEGYNRKKVVIDGIVNFPLIRVTGGVMLGILSYYWVQKISDLPKHLRYVLEGVCLTGVICCSAKWGKNQIEFIYVLLMFVGITFAFYHQVKIKFFTGRIIKFLSKISLYIYLSHYIIRIIFRNEFKSFSWGVVLGYLVCVTAFSALIYYLVNKTTILLKRFKKTETISA